MTNTLGSKIEYVTNHPETVKAEIIKRFSEAGYAVTVQYMPFRKTFAIYGDDEHALFTAEQVASQEMNGLVAVAIESWRLPFA